jgi:hypothetical protein
MADSRVEVDISVIGNALDSLKKISTSVNTLEKDMVKFSGNASSAFNTFKGVLGAEAVTKSLSTLTSLARGLFDTFITEGVDAAQATEDALNQLNRALAASGNYSKKASDDFVQFANSIQATTKFGDDAVLTAGALIGSLTNLSGKALRDATQSALDLSAALGIDLDSAARLVGKAAEGNVDAFKRYGLEIKKGNTDAQTLSNTLTVLNSKFGGAAVAQVNTFSGATTQLDNIFQDLTKEFGYAIIQNRAVIDTLKTAGQIVNEFTNEIAGNKQGLKTLVAEGLILAIQATNVFIVSLDALGRLGTAAFRALETAALATMSSITNILGLFSSEFKKTSDILNVQAQESAASVSKAFTEDTKLGDIAVLFARLEESATGGLDAIKSGADAAKEPVNGLKNSVQELTKEQLAAVEAGKKLAESLTSGTPATEAESGIDALKLKREADLITDEEYYAGAKELREKQFLDEQATLQAAQDADKEFTDKALAAKLASYDKYKKDEEKLGIEQVKTDKLRNEQRAQNFRSTMGTISTLMSSTSEELFRIGQAAAIATAIIDGIAAVQVALKSAPPPINFALAGIVGAVAAVNVAKIASTPPPKLAGGIDEVPAGFEGDRFPAFLNSGERVVPKNTNQDLKGFLSDSQGLRGIMASIDSKLDRLSNQIVVNVGSREIVNEIRSALDGGRVLA